MRVIDFAKLLSEIQCREMDVRPSVQNNNREQSYLARRSHRISVKRHTKYRTRYGCFIESSEIIRATILRSLKIYLRFREYQTEFNIIAYFANIFRASRVKNIARHLSPRYSSVRAFILNELYWVIDSTAIGNASINTAN